MTEPGWSDAPLFVVGMDLSQTDVGDLADLERVIEKGLDTFVEVGNALAEIRDRRLYREHHATFEAYCRDQWSMVRRQADRLIDAAAIADELRPIGLNPTTESQARELGPLRDHPDLAAEAMNRATADGPATAKKIADAVDQVAAENLERVPDLPNRAAAAAAKAAELEAMKNNLLANRRPASELPKRPRTDLYRLAAMRISAEEWTWVFQPGDRDEIFTELRRIRAALDQIEEDL